MNESGELTVEAFTSRTSPQENQCPICLNQYHNEDCSILTKFNHEMGRECLQTWLSEDNITCPICRQNLLERADFVPEPCRKYFHDLEYVVKRALQLDPEASRYAQEGMLRVCSWEFGAFILQLEDLVIASETAMTRMKLSVGIRDDEKFFSIKHHHDH
ncbi:hypothetical protein BS50DRAFT_14251 [Corynespora cassiicola Philippines]|uniref:RING-type domain-containing protein n=1 Tax=Corynespora cassiicola Philippines TaxID=1448308 RepID=A0A2T2P9Z5_CORCC|nr:hypothetical protein BS50DRAFT_14251 [Corynespora cassiicola Philippines]